MSKLLVVDDEHSICWGLSRLGESIGHEVVTMSSAEQALEQVERIRPDVIVLDVRLPGMDGLAAIELLRKRIGRVPIIVITAYGDLETAVDAVRKGAFEYIVKPFDLNKVERTLKRALQSTSATKADMLTPHGVGELVGSSPALQEVFKNLALAAASDASVLLSGESGTGKELAARAIHQYSDRAQGPFVAVNVASLSPTIAESELFGHTRGSFTGASADRIGLLAQANGGTLFLDEVADIPLPTQVKLLRVLEHGEVTPVGSNKGVVTNFRVVAATHQDLLHAVSEGRFRHDLYFRLCAFRLEIPALRDRRDDIPELANHFLRMIHRGKGNPPTFSPAALAELKSRPWHGNVRELRNAVEHAVIVARSGAIEPEHLPAPTDSPFATDSASGSAEEAIIRYVRRWACEHLAEEADASDLYERLLRVMEPVLFAEALQQHGGQCATAARQLGIHRTTLRKKLDHYGISGE